MSLLNKASLIQIPSGYKDGTLYSAKPTNGDGDFTFSRGSNLAATRVNSEGLIEKGRENLLLQSNGFNQAGWGISNATITGGQSGYDGSSNAWLLDSSSEGYLFQYPTSSNVGTLSIYAKANSVNNLRLRTFGASSNAEGFFDLANGVVGSSTNLIDLSIESIGGGWYRCSVVYDNAPSLIRIYPSVSSSTSSGTIGSIYIQDAMLNEGLVAQPYIPTTTTAIYKGITDDVPRVDYSGGGCPSLLLEPSRTQLLTHSEYFDDWLSNRLDRTANNIISPEGVQNAYKMAQQSGFTTAPNINVGGIAAGTYTISIFAKKGSWNYLAISFQGVSYFNLETGSKGTINSNHTATIEDYGNGWYRCAITRTTTTTQTPAFYFAESDNTLTTPDTQGYMYTYGAMFEAGSYSTSYLPTYGTSTTRVADSCSKTGISELIGQSEGTIYCEGTIVAEDSSLNRRIITISDGSTANAIQVFNRFATNKLEADSNVGGVSQFSFQSGDVGFDTLFKFALAYKENDIAFYVNGTQIGTDSSASIPATAKLAFSRGDDNFKHEGNINQALLFPTRLTNDELQELTK